MRAMADAGDPGAIGCTQATEIRYTPGLALVGPLPPHFALATVYAAALAPDTGDREASLRLIELLAGAQSAALRRAGGFDAPPATTAPGPL
jgi:molybdate transport system substrate-binding protein